jgi:hypothetical protein
VLRDAILPKFLAAAAFGPQPMGDAVPIDYVVPGDAPIEVWDSGMAVQAAAGDTPGPIGWTTTHRSARAAWWWCRAISRWPDAIAQELAGPPPATRQVGAGR